MDQHDGGFGYPPYDENPNTAGQGSGSSRGYREDPAAYGVDPSQQYDPNAPYNPAYTGQNGYDERGYAVQPPQGGYADAENPYAPHPIDPNYGYSYPQGNAYGNPQDYYAQQQPSAPYGQQPPVDPYGQPVDPYAQRQNTGRYPENPDSAYATRLQMTDYSKRGATGRTVMPPEDENYPYTARSATGRTSMPRDGYTEHSTTGRMRMPDDVEEFTPRGQTSRTRMPQGEDEYTSRTARSRYPQSEDRYARDLEDDEEAYERPRSSGKKKRTKFGKFMHALGLYLAQLPSKTLILIGGGFAVLVAAVILIAVLTQNSDRTQKQDVDQLAITDVTITPSLAPTNTPVPTEAVSPTPALPTLTENIAKAGTVSDLLPDIQKRLVDLGYMEQPDGGYTNKYGPITKSAIRLFQLKNFDTNKSWDGIIGNTTYTLLMSDQAKPYFLSRGDGDDRTKVITKLVQDVTKLQTRLIELGYLTTGSATGLYGNTTVLAVQTFQEYHGLPMDGIAGQETLKLIYSAEAMTAAVGKVNNKTKMTVSPSASLTTTPNPGASTSPSTSPTTKP
jgi:peptidoglycan hydrolase-like protein with peptidoglycan-binding domain